MNNKHACLANEGFFIAETQPRRRVRRLDLDITTIQHIGHIHDIAASNGCDAVWIMPGSNFSLAGRGLCERAMGDPAYHVWFSVENMDDEEYSPGYAKARRESTAYVKDTHIQFPEYTAWCEDEKGNQWECPTPGTLLATVLYLQEQLQTFIFCSSGRVGVELLRTLTRGRLVEKVETDTIPYQEMTVDLIWHRVPSSLERKCKYLHAFDKNWQYGGAAATLRYGVGKPQEDNDYQANKAGLWKIISMDTRESTFNNSILPLIITGARPWVHTCLADAAFGCGVKLELGKGFIWNDSAAIFDKWAKHLWASRAAFKGGDYIDKIAADNARRSSKLVGNAAIGRLNVDYSGELCRPDINRSIIQQARANGIYSMRKWSKLGYHVVHVYRDEYFFFSNEANAALAVPGILEHSQELRGYKHTHTFKVNDRLLDAFKLDTRKLHKALNTIKQEDNSNGL